MVASADEQNTKRASKRLRATGSFKSKRGVFGARPDRREGDVRELGHHRTKERTPLVEAKCWQPPLPVRRKPV
jgi:hypothetical protein